MKKLLILATALSLAVPAYADIIGGKSSATACLDLNDLNKLWQFVRANDKVAYDKLWISRALLGSCVQIQPGTTVTVNDSSLLSGALCVRPEGETECFWTLKKLVVH